MIIFKLPNEQKTKMPVQLDDNKGGKNTDPLLAYAYIFETPINAKKLLDDYSNPPYHLVAEYKDDQPDDFHIIDGKVKLMTYDYRTAETLIWHYIHH